MEAQIEESQVGSSAQRSPKSIEEVQTRRKKDDLTLSRKHILHLLESSTNERYSELLRRTLVELDTQIAALS